MTCSIQVEYARQHEFLAARPVFADDPPKFPDSARITGQSDNARIKSDWQTPIYVILRVADQLDRMHP
jgi:hypothetical protein